MPLNILTSSSPLQPSYRRESLFVGKTARACGNEWVLGWGKRARRPWNNYIAFMLLRMNVCQQEEWKENDISMELKRVYSKSEPKGAARARYFNTFILRRSA